MEWFYVEQRKPVGPVEESEIRRLIAEGRLKPNDYIWNPEMGTAWARLSSIETFAASVPVSDPLPEKKGAGLHLKNQQAEVQPTPKVDPATQQMLDAIEAKRNAPPAARRRFWGYDCPECGGKVKRDYSEGAQKWFGLAGALLYMAFGSLYCDECGEIKRRQFPAWDQLRLWFGSLMLIVAAGALLALCYILVQLAKYKT